MTDELAPHEVWDLPLCSCSPTSWTTPENSPAVCQDCGKRTWVIPKPQARAWGSLGPKARASFGAGGGVHPTVLREHETTCRTPHREIVEKFQEMDLGDWKVERQDEPETTQGARKGTGGDTDSWRHGIDTVVKVCAAARDAIDDFEAHAVAEIDRVHGSNRQASGMRPVNEPRVDPLGLADGGAEFQDEPRVGALPAEASGGRTQTNTFGLRYAQETGDGSTPQWTPVEIPGFGAGERLVVEPHTLRTAVLQVLERVIQGIREGGADREVRYLLRLIDGAAESWALAVTEVGRLSSEIADLAKRRMLVSPLPKGESRMSPAREVSVRVPDPEGDAPSVGAQVERAIETGSDGFAEREELAGGGGRRGPEQDAGPLGLGIAPMSARTQKRTCHQCGGEFMDVPSDRVNVLCIECWSKGIQKIAEETSEILGRMKDSEVAKAIEQRENPVGDLLNELPKRNHPHTCEVCGVEVKPGNATCPRHSSPTPKNFDDTGRGGTEGARI